MQSSRTNVFRKIVTSILPLGSRRRKLAKLIFKPRPHRSIWGLHPSEITEQKIEDETRVFNERIDILKKSTLVASLSKDSVCIDCGANIGEVTAVFAETGARVYAFEPHPIAFKKLSARFDGHSNVVLINKGVMDKNTTCKLYHSDLSTCDPVFFSQASSVYISQLTGELCDEVELVDLVEFITNLHTSIDILKLDIEGAEFCVLEQIIHKQLYRNIQSILVETHDDRIPEIREIAIRVRDMIKEQAIDNIDLSWY